MSKKIKIISSDNDILDSSDYENLERFVSKVIDEIGDETDFINFVELSTSSFYEFYRYASILSQHLSEVGIKNFIIIPAQYQLKVNEVRIIHEN